MVLQESFGKHMIGKKNKLDLNETEATSISDKKLLKI